MLDLLIHKQTRLIFCLIAPEAGQFGEIVKAGTDAVQSQDCRSGADTAFSTAGIDSAVGWGEEDSLAATPASAGRHVGLTAYFLMFRSNSPIFRVGGRPVCIELEC